MSKWNLHRAIVGFSGGLAWLAATLALGVALLPAAPASAMNFCSKTATNLYKACSNEMRDDFWTGAAVCANLEDPDERAECGDDNREAKNDAKDECLDQRDARLALCEDLGEERYDPDFDPDDFTDEFDNQNPYWPLKPGNHWVFAAPEETITVDVLDETKLIEGVTCIVVRDLVEEDGDEIEDTDDWYGQALNGDVWYTGEISQNFELFDGDDPEEPELVDVEGSWKTARDGAKPGITMFAAPLPGTVYRQEIAFGEAEDAAEVLSNDYSYGDDPALDELVPEELADLLCDDDCVVTREFTPVEPGIEALKYYAPGIGVFLEVEDGEIVQLVECNVDPRCDDLPDPED